MLINPIKNILSTIIVENKKNIYIVKVTTSKNIVPGLNFLWDEGFIYGYSLVKQFEYKIFLKKNSKKLLFFNNVKFQNENISFKRLKALNFLEKNSLHLLKTQLGLKSSKACLKKGLGGKILIRL